MEREIEDFLRYCRLERRLAPLTCSAYARDVRACVASLRAGGVDELRDVRPPDLRRFLAAEAERRPAIGSQARTVAALKCFFRFCVENEYLDRDPALVLRTPKKREALPDVLDHRELARLRHPAHAPARVRLRAPAGGREPAPDPGAARPQAPRLHPALHPRHRARAARGGEAAPLPGTARRGATCRWRLRGDRSPHLRAGSLQRRASSCVCAASGRGSAGHKPSRTRAQPRGPR